MKKHSIWASFLGVGAGFCCAGSVVALSFLTGLGLGFLINDFILFPILFIAFGIVYYTLYQNKKEHRNIKPLYLAIASMLSMLIGVFLNPLLWLGVVGLFTATIWDLLVGGKRVKRKHN